MKEIKIGFVGLGCRGSVLLKDVVLAQGERVTAVCDVYEDRVKSAAKAVTDAGQPAPKEYLDYNELIADGEVNTVIIATSWEYHIPIAIAAMRAGKAAATEVGGAYSVNECYELVRAYEETKTPFMFLENCCFGRREMMVKNMVEQGLFGKIVHCSGGYMHDLRNEIAFGKENRHYRLDNYKKRNCENYPTHELGPIADILGINRGNRFLTLSSTASKSEGLKAYIAKKKPDDKELAGTDFAQGDVVTTVIKCAGGETVTLTLNTTLPRFYSRGFTVLGTAGMYEEATDSVFLDRDEDIGREFSWRGSCLGNAKEYEADYEHPVWKKYIEDGVTGTHDGMDWLEFKTFFDDLRAGNPMKLDVYDAASLMVVSALSEQSVALAGAPVAFPDFTGGKWMKKSK